MSTVGTRYRMIAHSSKSKPVTEGAGVHLKRVFGNDNPEQLDPFLLLDEFHSNNPRDYEAGFPWHPHRGIETITYLIEGEIRHRDSMGNEGVIRAGGVQWMTAGSGIIHEEMPQTSKNPLWGIQLWLNLPRAHKMHVPRYRDLQSQQIPEITSANNTKIKIISGKVNGIQGPVKDVILKPSFFDVVVPPQSEFSYSTAFSDTVFAYVLDGEGIFAKETPPLGVGTMVDYTPGDLVFIRTNNRAVRFLFLTGTPIHEPIAWHGPIVMNTQEEIRLAFSEYQSGKFIKHN